MPVLRHQSRSAPTDGVRSMAARFGAALADAEARVREAEERRSAEEATRTEAELQVQAERKADEIEKKVTRGSGAVRERPGVGREKPS